jgi:hypothetical protein
MNTESGSATSSRKPAWTFPLIPPGGSDGGLADALGRVLVVSPTKANLLGLRPEQYCHNGGMAVAHHQGGATTAARRGGCGQRGSAMDIMAPRLFP